MEESGTGGSQFHVLLKQISAEHEREMTQLKTEIVRLKTKCGEPVDLDILAGSNYDSRSGIQKLGDASYVGCNRAKEFVDTGKQPSWTVDEPIVASAGAAAVNRCQSPRRTRGENVQTPTMRTRGKHEASTSSLPQRSTLGVASEKDDEALKWMQANPRPPSVPICSRVAVPVRNISPGRGSEGLARNGSRWTLLSPAQAYREPTAAVKLSPRGTSPMAALRFGAKHSSPVVHRPCSGDLQDQSNISADASFAYSPRQNVRSTRPMSSPQPSDMKNPSFLASARGVGSNSQTSPCSKPAATRSNASTTPSRHGNVSVATTSTQASFSGQRECTDGMISCQEADGDVSAKKDGPPGESPPLPAGALVWDV